MEWRSQLGRLFPSTLRSVGRQCWRCIPTKPGPNILIVVDLQMLAFSFLELPMITLGCYAVMSHSSRQPNPTPMITLGQFQDLASVSFFTPDLCRPIRFNFKQETEVNPIRSCTCKIHRETANPGGGSSRVQISGRGRGDGKWHHQRKQRLFQPLSRPAS